MRVRHQREILEHIKLKAPQHLIEGHRQRLLYIRQRIMRAVAHRFESNRQQLLSLSNQLEAVSPQHILNKGFAVALHNEEAITNSNQVQVGDRLLIQLAEGTIEVQVISPEQSPPKEVQLSLFD